MKLQVNVWMLAAVCLASVPLLGQNSPVKSMLPGGADKWELTWREEFDGLDAALTNTWVSQNGPSGHILCSRWRENAVVTNGLLRLVSRKEKRGGQEWTAGNIWTKQAFQYGYFECRYKYAGAEALNNSFWLMPTGKVPAGQKHFELDINEGHFPNKLNTNIHNHSDRTKVNGKFTHPTSSRSFNFGVRPDVTIQLETPITTRRLRFSSNHGSYVHLGEFRIYNVNPAGYPDALSPTADKDKPGLVNFAREAGTKIGTSGFLKTTDDTSKNLLDGRIETRWTSQKEGEKWVEFEFADQRTIGCIQFLNGYGKPGDWKSLLDNYRVAYHDGTKWVEMAKFDVKDGTFNFAREFHIFGFEWSEQELVFYLDGKELRREKNNFCFSPAPVWLSLAVIAWHGTVTDAIDGAAMEVDYVRVYQKRAK
ncbi:MAG: family 16 glycosylhydrolase [Kiritimatiellaeota bacterium]|nr:family 16 glycosylhydrolase [Kiritimatiellota bacterium]